jgi:hypothetical protein
LTVFISYAVFAGRGWTNVFPLKGGGFMGKMNVVGGLLALAIAIAMSGACADESETSTTPLARPVFNLSSASAAVSATSEAGAAIDSAAAMPDAGYDAGSAEPDLSYAIAVPLAPWMNCTVYPEGVNNDPARQGTAWAEADGEVRFYPPSQSWGTRLTLDCTLNATPEGQYLVDLNDSSTFKRESGSALDMRRTGVRSALKTEDLSTISLNDLLQQGYPPRPPAQSTSQYAKWVQSVTTPVDIYSGPSVARFGVSARVGVDEGFVSGTYPNTTVTWTGIVQGANGFISNGTFPEAAVWGTDYDLYSVLTLFPGSVCQGPGCNTSIWAGIGGYITAFPGIPGVNFVGGLIQNGFDLVGTDTVYLFYEYAYEGPGNLGYIKPPPGMFTPGDDFLLAGWSATSPSCQQGDTGAWGCYFFEDITTNWTSTIFALGKPANTVWAPSTVEYVAEWVSHQNANYEYDVMQGGAWDSLGNYHSDPGDPSGVGDPYVVSEQLDSSNSPVSTVGWDLASEYNSPQDPVTFFFKLVQ